MISHDSGFIMTCLCYRLKLFFDIFEKNGLYNLHIYSILGNLKLNYVFIIINLVL